MKINLEKIQWMMLIICITVICVIGINVPVYGDEIIDESEFEDNNLYNYVIKNYDVNGNGQLEKNEAEVVTEIVLNSRIELGEDGNIDDLSSLKGLEHFVNLTCLIVQGKTSIPITDISALKNNKKLKHLEIRQQWYINDFSVLSGLVNLEYLELWNTNCRDISFLKNMTKLQYLAITDGNLTNTEAIAKLTNLEKLCLYNCGLREVSFVSRLNKLQWLDISENDITDFSTLINIKDTLGWLELGGYDTDYQLGIENLMFLGEMQNLEYLSLSDSNIEEIPDLTGLTKLTCIRLGYNYLTIDDVINKLPTSITSQENWIQDSMLDSQKEKVPEIITEPATQQNTEFVTEKETETSSEKKEDTTTEIESEEETTSKEEIASKNDSADEQYDYYDIEIIGEFDSEVYLLAEEKRNLKEYKKTIEQLMNNYENAVDIQIYDIAAYDVKTDKRLQPNGRAKISLAFNEVDGCEYIVFELAENGDYKEIRSYLSDGELHFYTENINSYMMVTLDESGVYKERAKGSEGRLLIVVTVIGVVVVIIGGVLIFIEEKRRHK